MYAGRSEEKYVCRHEYVALCVGVHACVCAQVRRCAGACIGVPSVSFSSLILLLVQIFLFFSFLLNHFHPPVCHSCPVLHYQHHHLQTSVQQYHQRALLLSVVVVVVVVVVVP